MRRRCARRWPSTSMPLAGHLALPGGQGETGAGLVTVPPTQQRFACGPSLRALRSRSAGACQPSLSRSSKRPRASKRVGCLGRLRSAGNPASQQPPPAGVPSAGGSSRAGQGQRPGRPPSPGLPGLPRRRRGDVLLVHPQGGDGLGYVRVHDLLLAAYPSSVATTSGTRRDGQSAAEENTADGITSQGYSDACEIPLAVTDEGG